MIDERLAKWVTENVEAGIRCLLKMSLRDIHVPYSDEETTDHLLEIARRTVAPVEEVCAAWVSKARTRRDERTAWEATAPPQGVKGPGISAEECAIMLRSAAALVNRFHKYPESKGE